MTPELMDQIGIVVFSGAAVLLLNLGVLCGAPIGLVGQAFWLRTALRNGQWGVVVLTAVFALAYGVGCVRLVRRAWARRRARRTVPWGCKRMKALRSLGPGQLVKLGVDVALPEAERASVSAEATADKDR